MGWARTRSTRRRISLLVSMTLGTSLTVPAWSTARAADKLAERFGRLEIDLGELVALPEHDPMPCPDILNDDECRAILASWAHYADLPRLVRAEEQRINSRHHIDLRLAHDLGYQAAKAIVIAERGYSLWHLLGFGGVLALLSGVAGIVVGVLAR